MKRLVLLFLSVLLVLMMACASGSSSTPTPEPPTKVPPTAIPVVIEEETPTTFPYVPEEVNEGIHQYWMIPVENGCEASDDSSEPTAREKEFSFAEDFSKVTYAGREYLQIGEHRYQSINESERPLILEFSELGFILYVYNVDDNPNEVDACLYFDFTLQD